MSSIFWLLIGTVGARVERFFSSELFFCCYGVTYIARNVEFVDCMPRNTHYHWLGKLVGLGGGGGGEGGGYKKKSL